MIFTKICVRGASGWVGGVLLDSKASPNLGLGWATDCAKGISSHMTNENADIVF